MKKTTNSITYQVGYEPTNTDIHTIQKMMKQESQALVYVEKNQIIDNFHQWNVVAKYDNKLIWSVSLYLYETLIQWEPLHELWSLRVNPDFRGHGVGSNLVKLLTHASHDQNLVSVTQVPQVIHTFNSLWLHSQLWEKLQSLNQQLHDVLSELWSIEWYHIYFNHKAQSNFL